MPTVKAKLQHQKNLEGDAKILKYPTHTHTHSNLLQRRCTNEVFGVPSGVNGTTEHQHLG